MVSQQAAVRRIFISHPGDVDVRRLVEGLRARGAEPYVLSDVAVLGSEILEALRQAVDRADLVVAILDGEHANPSFEAGVAYALGTPLLLIVSPDINIPSDLAGQVIVRAHPNDLDAINFVLDQVERRARSVSPRTSGPSERALGAAAAAELLERFRSMPQDERDVTTLLVEAIEASGAAAAANLDHDAGFDVGVWSDDLAAIGGNPLVVEVKRRLSSGATSQVLEALNHHPTARLALIVHLDPPQGTASTALETTKAPYPVLTISFEELIQSMAMTSLAEIIRRLRNQSVHGVRPS